MGSVSRIAPDGGTANIGRAEYDDGTFVCPDCGEQEDDAYMAVESCERFGTVLCDLCFEGRCERVEDGE